MTPEQARMVLDVDRKATPGEIDDAYKRLMHTVHPDVCRAGGRPARKAGRACASPATRRGRPATR